MSGVCIARLGTLIEQQQFGLERSVRAVAITQRAVEQSIDLPVSAAAAREPIADQPVREPQTVLQAFQVLIANEEIVRVINAAVQRADIQKISKKELEKYGLNYSVIFLTVDPATGERAPFLVAEQLGRGGHGVIKVAYNLSTGEKIALKVAHEANPSVDASSLMMMDHVREVTVLRMFDRFKGRMVRASQDGLTQKLYLAQELADGVDGGKLIRNLLDEMQDLSPRDVRRQEIIQDILIFAERFLGRVAEFHQQKLVHRDLKPHNVMVTKTSGQIELKLIDFGSSDTEAGKLLDAGLGTPAYLAPELIGDTLAFTQESDMFAVGKSLHDIFELLNDGGMKMAILLAKRNQSFDLNIEALQQFSAKLCHIDPRMRPTAAEAYKEFRGLMEAMGMAIPEPVMQSTRRVAVD